MTTGPQARRRRACGPVLGTDGVRIVDTMHEGQVFATEPANRSANRMALAGGAAAMALVAMFGEAGAFTLMTVAAALVGLIPWAFVAARRPIPLGLFMLVTLGAAAVIVVADRNPGGMFPTMLVVVYVARSTKRWVALGGAVLASALMIVALALIDGSAHEVGMVYFLGGLGISLLAGLMLRRQELLTAEVQAMHELAVEHRAVSERTHIAREVHDIVAHSLTVVLLHLTGARRALRTDPGRADEALALAEATGRSSLDSVRQMVDLLRADAGGSDQTPAPPQPGLDELSELIERARSGGLTVDVDVDTAPEADTIDPAVALVVFRIVQESLSNVLQHAPGARCAITLRPPLLEIVNTRSAAAPATSEPSRRTGLGLVGMAERARAAGGSFAAGPTDDGGWRVSVDLPETADLASWAQAR